MKNELKQTSHDSSNEPIAIIGMGCQFPGLDSDIEDVNAFYQMLINKQTPIKDMPKERWNLEEYYDPDRKKNDKFITRKGGFLTAPELFDAPFFKISSAEAKQMDPQQRIFLEVSMHALNHANIPMRSLKDSITGVYCGISTYEYSQLNYKDHIKFTAYTPIGIANSAAAGRLCHFLNLKGPSMAIDTACSSSFSALFLAVSALRTYECNMAIVGGVHLSLCPESFIGLTKASMLSAKGQCSSFDKNADGFVRSEGCAVVIVKRLSDALKDKDTIHAVIKSMVMNQNGDGTGLAAPSIDAQIDMHETALKQANLAPSDIDYIEAHGTGTIVGDPIEFNAIGAVHKGHHKNKPLVVGAVKSNIGHTISSSGLASLIKATCALKQEKIPANLHYSTPNEEIHPEQIPAEIPTETIDFKKSNVKKRIVQVSNFSFTGTNVAAILEEAPRQEISSQKPDEDLPQCFVLSANSEPSLKSMLFQYLEFLKNTKASLKDICTTLMVCKDHMKFRCAFVVQNKTELIRIIESNHFQISKVSIHEEKISISENPHSIQQAYLNGYDVSTVLHNVSFNKVEVPQYSFDRKPHWHEIRSSSDSLQWICSIYPLAKEEQLITIKAKIKSMLSTIINKSELNDDLDLEALGFTTAHLEQMDRDLKELFDAVLEIPSLTSMRYLTIDKLSRYIQQLLIPINVTRQPTITVLNPEPIAIIGMSCRFPKASNIDEFLSLLKNGETGMTDIPLDRWDNEKYYDPDPNALGKLYIKQLGFINDVSRFDAEFFNISPREAKLMSPQLRVFMENSYHALEHANLPLDAVKDTVTGVFVGVGTNEYPRVLAYQGVTLEDLNIFFATGNVLNALAGRVAYSFDFHGPIQAIDTACSSSMTAIHNACLSLQSGDCNMALAGGVNIILTPDSNITLSKARMLSPDSRCKTFSEDADGYGRSEGCGVVVLKRLSTAIKDNDTVLAVIKGTSINSDGKSGGFTVPNGTSQEEVILSALAKAHLAPKDIDFIEAHGTGTPLADPIELNTLVKIFAESHSNQHPLYVSSVKTNIGHSESASGVASVIKTILSIQSNTLFKHLNFKRLNPAIELKNTVIPLESFGWEKKDGLRTAGVSSFGFSGANAHIIIQETPTKRQTERTLPKECILVLSAKSTTALNSLIASYNDYLINTSNHFADICYTAATCRNHFQYRTAIIAASAQEASQKIQDKQYTISSINKEIDQNLDWDSLEALQKAYLNGYKIEWNSYFKSLKTSFNKITLPLYPFDKTEHWYGDGFKIKDTLIPKEWGFKTDWLASAIDKSNTKIQGNRWLYIGPDDLESALRAHGLTMTSENDNHSLSNLSGIIFAPGFQSFPQADIDYNINEQKRILKQFLTLVKQLDDEKIELQLIVITSNAIPELSGDAINIASSPIIGFFKTLILELPQFNSIAIDVDNHEIIDSAQWVIDEIHHNHSHKYEHLVAYRNKKRLVPRLKKQVIADHKRYFHGITGRYLITGGLGGLGLITAQALLSSGARDLVLISRHSNKQSSKEAVKGLQSLYPTAKIQALSVDVADKKQLKEAIKQINSDDLLRGVIHAAGAAIKTSLVEHKTDDVDYLYSAKVQGGWYLHEFTKDCDLDFFVVYSSISSVFGSNKESIYGATNSFLDALIAERIRLGLPGTAIQWGPWGEVGMASKRSRNQDLKKALISNAQGHALIKVLINGEYTHEAVISPDYLKFMLDFVPKPLPAFHEQLLQDLSSTDKIIHHDLSPWLSEYLNLSESKHLDECKQLLTDICKSILDMPDTEEINGDEGFFDLGFDSLMITELASEIKKRVDPILKIQVTIGFNHPTINKLSQFIKEELDQHLIYKQDNNLSNKPVDDSIAIIGMSCSFPNAPDVASFEHLIEKGLSGIKDIPPERWDNSKYYDSNMDAPRKSYVNKLGLVDNIDKFDANFFGISPREAQFIEPQQRLFLECCYKALENANYPIKSMQGSLTGVYAGVGPNEYYAMLEKSGFSDLELSAYSITGNVLNLIPGRVAYVFDLKGPSLSVDTACSSSLVAIHYACQSLRNKEIDYALAGGVNILLLPESNVTLCKARALAPDGLCKTFDERADGYARGEGCGVVFLKRFSDAIKDKDNILGVIKGSAVNNDGRTSGLTVPSGTSQEDVMKRVLALSKLTPGDISYIEAHGTGTPLGDPIEVQAVNQVYGKQRNKNNPLYIGTVKSNIGHLESAAGVAAVIKTVLGLKKHTIFKQINFNKLNPNIHLEETRIATENIEWTSTAKNRTAGINAFGFSGTNAHMIVQEYNQDQQTSPTRHDRNGVLFLSAASEESLQRLIEKYIAFLQTTTDDFADICYTAASCREHYNYRIAVVAKDSSQASQLLSKREFYTPDTVKQGNVLIDDPILQELTIDYLKGKLPDFSIYFQNNGETYLKVQLPNYAFDRKRFWPQPKLSNELQLNELPPLLTQMIVNSGIENPKELSLDIKLYNHTGNLVSQIEGFQLNSLGQNNTRPLENLYFTEWIPYNWNIQPSKKLPKLLVISSEPDKAQTSLKDVSYQLISNVNQIDTFEQRSLIFFFQQDQMDLLLSCFQRCFLQKPEHFILITENAYDVQEEDVVNPYHTMASSFWKSFYNELGLSTNYNIDIGSNNHLKPIFSCIFNVDNKESLLALRDRIYFPRLKKKTLPPRVIESKLSLDNNATYLITGGSGGIAKLLIRYLITRGAQHIVTLSRHECPDSILEEIKEPVQHKHYQVDVSQYQKMNKIIQDIQASPHPLKGVFHLAGIIHDGLIATINNEAMQKVLQSKMESALILHQLTKNLLLDQFVLFSSSASLLGPKGQANYSAANGFLDGLAHLRHHQGLPALSINWGPFDGIGMTRNLSSNLKSYGFIPLNHQDIEILDQLISSNETQLSPLPLNWGLYSKHSKPALALADLFVQEPPATEPLINLLNQLNVEKRIALLSQTLRNIVAQVLGMSSANDLHFEDDLYSKGLDSLMAMDIRARLQDIMQCPTLSLPIEYFINTPTLVKIAQQIAKDIDLIFLSQVNIPATLSDNEAIALTDSQFGFWGLSKVRYAYNLGTQVQLVGKLNKDFVHLAFDHVVKQNPAFWIHFDPEIPIQTIKKDGKFNIYFEDLSLVGDATALNGVFSSNIHKFIPLQESPLIKVFLYRINNDLHELHIVIPHIIVDGHSVDMVFEQFKRAYETLCQNQKLISDSIPNYFFDYVRLRNARYEKRLKDKEVFWKRYNKDFSLLRFARKYHLPDPSGESQHQFHYALDQEIIDSVIHWHSAQNLNISSGLTAASLMALSAVSNKSNIAFNLIHNGREYSKYQTVVGLFAEYKRLNIRINKNQSLRECINEFEKQLNETAPYQSCLHSIKDKGLKSDKSSYSMLLLETMNRLRLYNRFKKSKLSKKVINEYIHTYNAMLANTKSIHFKQTLNKWLNWKLPLINVEGLKVVITMTTSFFNKEIPSNTIANLKYNYPSHFGCLERPIGIHTLWIYFSRNQFGEPTFSINGAVTTECKDKIAESLKHILKKFTENNEITMEELI
ncbi:SDR family NAD(P)-dependent oxidoreductase [Legionella waltersii]|nr:SDR family NAD(P)-dependent oxidoreductase [Legionella waltersii]